MRIFFNVVFKRKTVISWWVFVSVFLTMGSILILDSVYESEAKIMVKPGRENFYSAPNPTEDPGKFIFLFDSQRQINSEMEILTSRILIHDVISQLGPQYIFPELKEKFMIRLREWLGVIGEKNDAEEALERFRKNLKVRSIRDSEIIRISFLHPDPERAKKVLDTLIARFLEHRFRIYGVNKSYQFFNEQSRLLEEKIKKMEEDLEAFKKRNAFVSLDEERSLLLQELGKIRSSLNETLIRKNETDQKIKLLRRQLSSLSPTVHLDRESEKNMRTISSLQEKIVELELKKRDLMTRYTDKVPFKQGWVERLNEDILAVRKKLEKARETNLGGKIREGRNSIYQHLEEELLNNEVNLRALGNKEKTLRVQINDYREKLEHFSKMEKEYLNLKQKIQIARTNFQAYLTRFEESRMSNAMDEERMTNISVIEPPNKPADPKGPKPWVRLVSSLFFGFLGGLGLAFFLEYKDDHLVTDEDVKQTLNAPVLGSLPKF